MHVHNRLSDICDNVNTALQWLSSKYYTHARAWLSDICDNVNTVRTFQAADVIADYREAKTNLTQVLQDAEEMEKRAHDIGVGLLKAREEQETLEVTVTGQREERGGGRKSEKLKTTLLC